MVQNSKSQVHLPKRVTYKLENEEAIGNPETVKRHAGIKKSVSKINTIVKSLENSLVQSEMYDNHLINTKHMDSVKKEASRNILEQARKENKQLLNVLQKQNSENSISRSSSRTQVDHTSSYGTVSLVHLQYKYEELLSSQEGLLRLLESKVKEAKQCYKENDQLREQMMVYSTNLDENKKVLDNLAQKYVQMKRRKDSKIEKLKFERDTLKLSHEKLLSLLQTKSLETDEILTHELLHSKSSQSALLFNEIRRNNLLQHENAKLTKEVAYIKGRSHSLRDLT